MGAIFITLLYIIIAAISTVLFQVGVRAAQDGVFEDEDRGITFLGGVCWPLTYPLIVVIVLGYCIYNGISDISEYIYKTFNKGN